MHHPGLLFQPFEDDDLGLQFDDGAGGGGLIDDRFLELLVVFRGEVVGASQMSSPAPLVNTLLASTSPRWRSFSSSTRRCSLVRRRRSDW